MNRFEFTLNYGYVKIHSHRTLSYHEVVINYPQSFYDNLLNSEPLQEDLKDDDLKPYDKDDFSITPVKSYKIAARVLSKENYYRAETHEILPIDLALGWNIMSKPKTIENNHIDITQSGRFYFWHIPSFDKISRSEIEINSANTHIGGINEQITKELEDINKGDTVYLEGYLVNVYHKTDHYRFTSSLTRLDTGAGACEVMLVTGVKKLKIND